MRNVAIALALVIATPLLAQPSGSYRITHRYVLGGEGGWDYIVPDPPGHRLFIGRQNRVMVVDEDRGTLLGEIAGIQGAHGTAIASAAGRGFATSGNDQSVVMFDLATFKVIGPDPRGRGCGRHHLRRPVRPHLHLQWRRSLLDRDRPASRHPHHQHSAWRQA